MDRRAVIGAPDMAHRLARRVFVAGDSDALRSWLVCDRCRVAWPITWGYTYLEPCHAAAWGR